MKTKLSNLKHRAAVDFKNVETHRLVHEAIACGFVACETHYPVFAACLMVWLALDLYKLYREL